MTKVVIIDDDLTAREVYSVLFKRIKKETPAVEINYFSSFDDLKENKYQLEDTNLVISDYKMGIYTAKDVIEFMHNRKKN